MRIRKARASDMLTCFAIRAENCVALYSKIMDASRIVRAVHNCLPGYYVKALKQKNRYFFVAERRGEIVGYFDLILTGKTEVYLYFFHVRYGLQRQGIGRMMMSFVERWVRRRLPRVKRLFLDSIAFKLNGGFYEALGFKAVGKGQWEGLPTMVYEKRL